MICLKHWVVSKDFKGEKKKGLEKAERSARRKLRRRGGEVKRRHSSEIPLPSSRAHRV